MHQQNSPTPGRPALTEQQLALLDYAMRDLENFRAADLTQLDPAGLILIVTRLLNRLDDALQLVDDMRRP